MQCVEKLLGTQPGPLAHAHAIPATNLAPVIGQEVALVDDVHFRFEGAPPHDWPLLMTDHFWRDWDSGIE